MTKLREALERLQIAVYAAALVAGAAVGLAVASPAWLDRAIQPALAVMLFVTFLQVPLGHLGGALRNARFFIALAVANFIVVPVLVAGLLPLLPDDPMLRLGVLLVLLTPCIDYVVTFTHLGRGDARLILVATPGLLLLQMLLLPLYLRLLLGPGVSTLIQPEPFIDALLWLIALPLVGAGLAQAWAARSRVADRAVSVAGLLPVPATALVLFLILAAMTPRLAVTAEAALRAAPVYLAYAALAPVAGLILGRVFGLEPPARRAVAFSAATRNSLVVLPFAFAVPDGAAVLATVIVTQTIIELASQLIYVRVIPRLTEEDR